MSIDPGSANARLLRAVHQGKLDEARQAIAEGADVNIMPTETGLAALHLAVGGSHFEVVKYLIEEAKAEIKPDGFGRWPTVIAAQCQASEELCDYIVEREAKALAAAGRDMVH